MIVPFRFSELSSMVKAIKEDRAMRRNRIIALVFCLLLLIPSHAGTAETPATSATSTLTLILSIEGDQVDVSAICRVPSPQRAAVTVYLQQRVGNTWITLDSQSNQSAKATAQCDASDGAQYRGYAQCMIYDGSGLLLESFGKYSSVKPER